MGQRFVFLYSELAGYVLASLQALASEFGAEIDVVHWPVNPEAPFELPANSNLRLTDRSTLDQEGLNRLLDQASPNAIIVSGWMDRGYVRAVRRWRNRIPVIVGMDNHWTGSPRQRLASWLSRFLIRRSFNRIWIPGTPQREYARRLGFSDSETLTGWYCADVEPFMRIGRSAEFSSPKLLYVGRYVPQKGVRQLWTAFGRFRKDFPQWELHCIGTGSEWDSRPELEGVFHHGFQQPQQLPRFIAQSTAFIMPSLWEPWGVVLQEMAAAGLPVLVSDAVGSATQFLKDGCNGFSFRSGDEDSLEHAMRRMAALSSDQILEMGQASARIALTLTPSIRSQQLLAFLDSAKIAK